MRSRGPHMVTVTVREQSGTGAAGDPVFSTRTVDVPNVWVHPVYTNVAPGESGGRVFTGTWRVFGGGVWPGGAASTVTWNGREFAQQGEAVVADSSPTTAHFEVTIGTGSTEVK